jgi:hypothetical protein
MTDNGPRQLNDLAFFVPSDGNRTTQDLSVPESTVASSRAIDRAAKAVADRGEGDGSVGVRGEERDEDQWAQNQQRGGSVGAAARYSPIRW